MTAPHNEVTKLHRHGWTKGSKMEMRTTASQVTFRRPFHIAAIASAQPAGVYTLRINDAFTAPSVAMGWQPDEIFLELEMNGHVTPIRVNAQELCEALVRDGDQVADAPTAQT